MKKPIASYFESTSPPVFFASAGFIFVITIISSMFPELANRVFQAMQKALISQLSWFYVLAVGSILFFSLWLMVSRYGDIRLGSDHDKPEYSTPVWLAMLFSAGMGIGLLFFGVAEPIMHFTSPPVGEPSTIASAKEAMKITFFHWGLHAWCIYAVVAVILAYFSYRKKLPLLPRSIFYPLVGDKIYGWFGNTIDTFAVLGTMFGVATSLGLGVSQVNAGLAHLFGLPQTTMIQIGLIAGITALATISVVLGLDKGIKNLSIVNMVLAIGLMLSILLLGETTQLIKTFVENTGAYFSDIIYKTFQLYSYERKESWIGGWTLLYWGWWVSWAPFVGMFIARISKGRRIRDFMMGVLFIPTGFTFLWMTVLGNSAISLILQQGLTEFVATVNENVAIALFSFLEFFPMSTFLSLIAVILVITFFVSSSDSGSLVIDTLASGGAQEPETWQRVFWATLEGVIASVLLLAGGLNALQTMTIVSAFPMLIIIIVGVMAFIKALREDYLHLFSIQTHHTSLPYVETASWKERLNSLTTFPEKQGVRKFLTSTIKPALEELKAELQEQGKEVRIEQETQDSIEMVITKNNVDDFMYGVRIRSFGIPTYIKNDDKEYCRAEVFSFKGGQEYDVYGYTKDQVIADIITQYEKHLHYLHLASNQGKQ